MFNFVIKSLVVIVLVLSGVRMSFLTYDDISRMEALEAETKSLKVALEHSKMRETTLGLALKEYYESPIKNLAHAVYESATGADHVGASSFEKLSPGLQKCIEKEINGEK